MPFSMCCFCGISSPHAFGLLGWPSSYQLCRTLNCGLRSGNFLGLMVGTFTVYPCSYSEAFFKDHGLFYSLAVVPFKATYLFVELRFDMRLLGRLCRRETRPLFRLGDLR